MLGVSVDYPVLMIGHRKRRRAPPPATRGADRPGLRDGGGDGACWAWRRWCSPASPGLAQLGVFSAVGGVLTCALASPGLLLPPLIVAANLAPVSAGDPAWLLR